MFCENCGNKINENDKFCRKCGQKIVHNEINDADNTNTVATSNHKTEKTDNSSVVIDKASEKEDIPGNPKKSNNNGPNKKIIAGAIVVIAVIAIAIIAGLFKPKKVENSNTAISDAPEATQNENVEKNDDKQLKTRNEVYTEVVKELINEYGIPYDSIAQLGENEYNEGIPGVYFVKCVDLNADGEDELFVGFMTDEPDYENVIQMAIYTYNNGVAEKSFFTKYGAYNSGRGDITIARFDGTPCIFSYSGLHALQCIVTYYDDKFTDLLTDYNLTDEQWNEIYDKATCDADIDALTDEAFLKQIGLDKATDIDWSDYILGGYNGFGTSQEEQDRFYKAMTDFGFNIVHINIHQVDNTNFPEVTFYASITDAQYNVIDDVQKSDFIVKEIDSNGNINDVTIDDVYKVINKEDRINLNLVMDASGSMNSNSKLKQAQNAAKTLLKQMKLDNGDKVEIITFDDYVYLKQEFTNEEQLLTKAIDSITTGDDTALYDAIYSGLYQTYYEKGPKCVIAVTDGLENASSYTFDDVVNMSQTTGIPVYIVGIGDENDADELSELAKSCSGQYFSANTDDLENILESIYVNIYKKQQDYYVFKFKSTNENMLDSYRNINLSAAKDTNYIGGCMKEYVPKADVSGSFSDKYMNKDYMIADSDSREITDSDLQGLSLAELRIARNEIFARHGRQFKDAMLNQWFYSKVWYLNIPQKYAPDVFDKTNPSPLNKTEQKNVNYILSYEKQIMSSKDIYPDASKTLLTEYDLALSKAVLKKALEQIDNYQSSEILAKNKQLITDAINREDISY